MRYVHKVQYYETDQMKIVHHSNYIRWFEETRVYMMEQMGLGYGKMEEMGIISPVMAINAEYKSMCRFPDIVNIDGVVSEFNGVKMVVSYTVRDSVTGEVRCKGESTHCFLDSNGKLIRMDRAYPEIYQMLKGLME
ncbi:MAG TPA: acyl-CoA thioesterase [Lachnospiraceae bacterium]|nr:acyl-CoA thioesterase [Lachnospiraceae bacterium]